MRAHRSRWMLTAFFLVLLVLCVIGLRTPARADIFLPVHFAPAVLDAPAA